MANSRTIIREDYVKYLKHDAVYNTAKDTVERDYCWVRRLDAWTQSQSPNLLAKIVDFFARFFAEIHDYINKDEIHKLILEQTVDTYQGISLFDENFSQGKPASVLEEIGMAQFLYTRNLEKTAVVSAMLTSGNHEDLQEAALQYIQKKYGLSNVSLNLVRTNPSTSTAKKIEIEQEFEVQIEKEGNKVTLGTITINANYDFEREKCTRTLNCNWYEALTDALKVKETEQRYEINESDFDKYVRPNSVSDALTECTKALIQSRYNIDCELERLDYNLPMDRATIQRVEGRYHIRNPNTHEIIGQIAATGTFYRGATQKNNGKINFDVTFEDRRQLKKIQEEQRQARINEMVAGLF